MTSLFSAEGEDLTPSFSMLYRRYARELIDFVRSRVGSGPPEPEDVAQQAFANFMALKDQSQVRNPRAFLYRTAANILINHGRHAAVTRRYAEGVVGEKEIFGNRDDLSPELVLLDREQMAVVEKALLAMPARRSRYLLLNRMDGLTLAEIAEREGVTPNIVRKQIAKAVRDCLAALEAAGMARKD